MKTKGFRIIVISFLAITLSLLIGCTTNDSLSEFSLMLDQTITSTSLIDDVSEEDLSETSVDNLSVLSFENETVYQLSVDLTVSEKIDAIRLFHADIVNTQLQLNVIRDEAKITLETIKTTIASIKSEGIVLNDSDIELLKNWLTELRVIKLGFQSTIGDAYAKMRDLRGLYDLEHIDLIYTTFEEVLTVLEYRLDLATTLQTIMNEANEILESYLIES